MATVYFIHDNAMWLEPFIAALDKSNIPHIEWDISEGSFDSIDLTQEPPEGIFYNRVSPSSHLRNKRYAMELTMGILGWLESHNRVVINGTKPFQLEMSKMNQISVLKRYGISTPKTIAVLGKTRLAEKAKELNEFPFLMKHNRSGSGRGVRDFYSVWELEKFLAAQEKIDSEEEKEWPIDNIHLLQSFVQNSYFYRLEFCDGKLIYGIKVKTGEFENCPNDLCQLDLNGQKKNPQEEEPKFRIIRREDFVSNPRFESVVLKIQKMLTENGYSSGSVELIEDPNDGGEGEMFVFDVNANTNFNHEAEMNANLAFEETGVGAFVEMIEKFQQKFFGASSSESSLSAMSISSDENEEESVEEVVKTQVPVDHIGCFISNLLRENRQALTAGCHMKDCVSVTRCSGRTPCCVNA